MTKETTYTLPIYWASYPINGDASGLEDEVMGEINRLLEIEIPGDCVDVGEHYWFSSNTKF